MIEDSSFFYPVWKKITTFASLNNTIIYKMCTTTLHLRLDEDMKNQASDVFEHLGLDLPTAIRIFLRRSIAVDGMPFELKNNRSEWDRMPCSWTVDELKEQVRLSLDDIKNGRTISSEEFDSFLENYKYGS